jgi:NitT/TauT family transport system permease protein
MGGFRLAGSWPFVTDLTWDRFRESALYVTMKRILTGFLLAVAVALPLGILMGSFTKFYYFFEPVRIAGLYLPLPAFVPLTLFWAGIGESQKYLYLFICNFVVLLPYTIVAIQSVPQVYLDTAATLGLTRGQIVRRVLIGVAKPEIWKALRFTFGVGWTWIILAEQIGVDNGLGYIIWTSERRSHPEHVYVVILLIMLLAFLINALWTLVIDLLFPHERSR